MTLYTVVFRFPISPNRKLRGSASTVLTVTAGQVNGRWQILTPHRIATPKPIVTKFGPINYIRERTPKTNLVQITPLLQASWQMVEYNVFVPFYLGL